jgi:hypothetical protein
MLSPYSQYSPQGVIGQFPGLFGPQTPGVPQFGGLPFAGSNPYLQGQPYQQGQWSPSQSMYSMYPQGTQPAFVAGQHVVLQVGSLIGQLAQQICTQGAITQQTGFALVQLAQQLIQQGLHSQGLQGLHANSGIGADAAHLFAGQQLGGGQPFMMQPFAGPFGPFAPGVQSPYGGLSPQLGPSWNGLRPTTIQ